VKKMLVLAALTAVAALSVSPVAQAEERTCRGTLGAVTVDNLRVPQNATCTLNGTRVGGNVVVERGATLAANNIRVRGSVQAEGARSVRLQAGSRVNGDVQLKAGGSATVRDSFVGGTLLLDTNNGTLDLSRNRIEGNLQAFQNTGALSIFNNTIDENLQCKANNPPPTGGGNIVGGNKEDQCAGL